MQASVAQTLPKELAAMAQARTDHEEFLSLLEAHQRPLFKVCWTYSRSQHDREDLLQEIVAQLWSAFRTYDRSRKFSTWMYRVALNVAIDFCRRKRRWHSQTTSLDETVAAALTSAADPAKFRQLEHLRELLGQQTNDDRAILLLFLEGNSYREIGEVLGISESNVGTRLNRLKKSLRQSALGPHELEQGE